MVGKILMQSFLDALQRTRRHDCPTCPPETDKTVLKMRLAFDDYDTSGIAELIIHPDGKILLTLDRTYSPNNVAGPKGQAVNRQTYSWQGGETFELIVKRKV